MPPDLAAQRYAAREPWLAPHLPADDETLARVRDAAARPEALRCAPHGRGRHQRTGRARRPRRRRTRRDTAPGCARRVDRVAAVPHLELLPAVDVADGQAVQLVQGVAGSEKRFGDPVEAALRWQQAGAEWMHLVDLDAAFGRGNNRDLLA